MKLFRKKQELVLQGYKNCIRSIAVSNSKKYVIACAHDGKVIIWKFLRKKSGTC